MQPNDATVGTRALLSGLEERRIRDRRRRRVGTIVVTVVLLVGGTLVYRQTDDLTSPHAIGDPAAADRNARKPLGNPPDTAHGVGSFRFTAEQVMTDEPVAYDPCRTIPWAVHDEMAPPGTDQLVEQAVTEIARATGLVFVRRDVGERADYHSVTAKDGRSPIIIDWVTPTEVRGLLGSVAGVGGSAFLPDRSGERIYVTGAIALDSPQLRRTLARPGGTALVRAIILHELGHVVGLDHVDDRGELMHRGRIDRRDLGPGDREGLARLGSGRCER